MINSLLHRIRNLILKNYYEIKNIKEYRSTN